MNKTDDEAKRRLIEEAKAEIAADPSPENTPSSGTVPGVSVVRERIKPRWPWLNALLLAGLLTSSVCGLFALWLIWSLSSAAKSGVSGTEFFILPFLPLYGALPYILLVGGICGLILAIRTPKPWQRAVVALMALAVLGSDGWYVYDQAQAKKASEAKHNEFTRVMSKDETLAKITSCEISSIMLEKNEITLTYQNNRDAKGEWVYKASHADPKYYADYVAAAKRVSAKCEITYFNDAGEADPTSEGTRWVTLAQAKTALDSCEIKTFNYTGGMGDEAATGTDTGIKLVDYGWVKHLYVAKQQEAAMVPIARAAQKTCDGMPQFWHDGAYEQSSAAD